MSGQTSLHRAALRDGAMQRFQLISLLLAYAADANIKENAEYIPYDYAVKNYEQSTAIHKPAAAASAALLLQATLGIEGKDAQGRTPAYWAKLSGSEVVQSISAGEIEITQLGGKAIRKQIIFELLKAIGQKFEQETL